MAFGEDEEPVKFRHAKALKESPRALLVRFDGKERWCPKSAIHDDSEVYDAKDNADGTLALVAWWWSEHEND